MPWSPMRYWPQIEKELKSQGIEYRVPVGVLQNAIMRHTGLIKPETISRTIEAFVRVGYVFKTPNNDIFSLVKPSGQEYVQRDEQEAAAFEHAQAVEKQNAKIDQLLMSKKQLIRELERSDELLSVAQAAGDAERSAKIVEGVNVRRSELDRIETELLKLTEGDAHA